jgi:hypothetical protein
MAIVHIQKYTLDNQYAKRFTIAFNLPGILEQSHFIAGLRIGNCNECIFMVPKEEYK